MPYLTDLILYTLESRQGRWSLQFTFDHAALLRLMAHRLGRTTVLTTQTLPQQALVHTLGLDHHLHQRSR